MENDYFGLGAGKGYNRGHGEGETGRKRPEGA